MQVSRLPRRVVRIAALLLLLLGWFNAAAMAAGGCGSFLAPGRATRITSYNVCYTKLLRVQVGNLCQWAKASDDVF